MAKKKPTYVSLEAGAFLSDIEGKMTKKIGILMTPENVRAIDEVRKTQTRRLRGLGRINENPDRWKLFNNPAPGAWGFCNNCDELVTVKNPYGIKGDLLCLKEKWRINSVDCYCETQKQYHLIEVDYGERESEIICGTPEHVQKARQYHKKHKDNKYGSPLFMPKWCARTWYRRTDNRPPERLQDISEYDVFAEGIPKGGFWAVPSPAELRTENREKFARLWNSIHTKHGERWEDNPWVWPIGFERIEIR